MRIESLLKYSGKNPNGYFNDLPPQARMAAWRWLGRLQENRRRKGKATPQWVRALLVGQAKRLALMSDAERSAWGRSMLAKRGGHAVQRRYVAEDRNPTAAATRARTYRFQREIEGAAKATERRKIQAQVNTARLTL
jgi:hypothetical protein